MTQKRILLVEDEAVTAMDIQSYLVRCGYEVPMVVASGEDAVLAAAEAPPHLILMDIRLLGPMSGIEAAAEIRKKHAIPVVFMTAHCDVAMISEAKKTEPYGYLIKPCNKETLMTTIEVTLFKGEADAARRKAELERDRLIIELQEALAKVKLLQGFLPICSCCKSIRDDRGNWRRLEDYIEDHSEAEFSHGVCPECMPKVYPDFARKP